MVPQPPTIEPIPHEYLLAWALACVDIYLDGFIGIAQTDTLAMKVQYIALNVISSVMWQITTAKSQSQRARF